MATVTFTPTASASVSESRSRSGTAIALGMLALAVVLGLTLPNVADGDAGTMTHYMALLAANQPWNLLFFMVVPVVLAETLAVSELVVLFRRERTSRAVRAANRWAGLLAGPWFATIVVYLTANAVLPLTSNGAWHGPADLVAVFAYLLGVVPLAGVTLVELGVLGHRSEEQHLRMHATFVGIFLVVAHVAMVFGMLDPTLLGWDPPAGLPMGHGM